MLRMERDASTMHDRHAGLFAVSSSRDYELVQPQPNCGRLTFAISGRSNWGFACQLARRDVWVRRRCCPGSAASIAETGSRLRIEGGDKTASRHADTGSWPASHDSRRSQTLRKLLLRCLGASHA